LQGSPRSGRGEVDIGLCFCVRQNRPQRGFLFRRRHGTGFAATALPKNVLLIDDANEE
jgi:hypothetical protein